MTHGDDVEVLPCLHITSDLGPIGLSASQWLLHGYKIRGTFTWDLLHRLHCAHLQAVTEAGLVLPRLEAKQVMKLRHGPFGGSSNHSVLQEAAEEFFELTGMTNPLFDCLCEQIAEELEVRSPDAGDAAHMRTVWKSCQGFMTTSGKGSSVKSSRWFAFEVASRKFLPQASTVLMITLFLGFKRGWWRTLNQCPLFHENSTFAEDDLSKVPGEQPAQPSASADGEDHSEDSDERDAEEEEDPTNTRYTMASGQAEIKKRRSACVSTLQYTTKVLAKPLNLRLWRVLAYCPATIEARFQELVSAFKTKDSVRELHARLVDGELEKMALEVLLHTQDMDLRCKLGLSDSSRSVSALQLKHDRIVVGAAWRYMLNMAGALALLSLQYRMPPLIYLGLMDPRQEAGVLDELQAAWATLCKLEETAIGSRACAAWMSTMCWPSQEWARQQLISLAENDFASIDRRTEQNINMYADSILSTLPVENMFNSTREAASHNRRGHLGPLAVWHNAVYGAPVLADHDLTPVAVTAAARTVSATAVPKAAFHYTDGSCTVTDAEFQDLCAEKPTWPSINPESMSKNGLRWRLAVSVAGDWAKVEAAWLSALVQPGFVVYHRTEKTPFLVIQSCQHGFLCCRAPIRKVGDVHFVQIQMSAMQHGVMFKLVDDLSMWRASVSEPVAPASLPQDQRSSMRGAFMIRCGRADTLLRTAAKCGFRGLGVTQLRRLHQELKVAWKAGNKPKTEVSLVEALFRYSVVGCTDHDIEQCLIARGFDPSAAVQMEAPVAEPELLEKVIEEDDFDDEEIKQEYEKAMEAASTKQRAVNDKLAVLRSMLNRGASSSSGSGDVPNASGRKFMPKKTNGYSKAEAQKWCPDGVRIHKDLNENRWRTVSASIGSKSKSYGTGTGLSDFEAMQWVLMQTWRAFSATTGQACPFDFGAIEPRFDQGGR